MAVLVPGVEAATVVVGVVAVVVSHELAQAPLQQVNPLSQGPI